MYKSPDPPPLMPAPPFPATRTFVPLSTPGGILTKIRSDFTVVPPPLHTLHRGVMEPLPLHWGHGEENRPLSTLPLPLQVGQTAFFPPGSSPEPPQCPQGISFWTLMCVAVPV